MPGPDAGRPSSEEMTHRRKSADRHVVESLRRRGAESFLATHPDGLADNIGQSCTVNLSSESLDGTWKLRVNDNCVNDTGYINSWSVTF